MFDRKALILFVNFYKFVIFERLRQSPQEVLIVLLVEGEFIQNVENSVILNQVNQINPNSIIYN